MENTANAVEQKYKKWIILLSVVIPLAVALAANPPCCA